MKFRVTMKDPDTLYDAIQEAVEDDTRSIADDDEREAVSEVRRKKLREAAAPWFQYGEYLTVEIDTDDGTCVVVKPR